MFNTGISLTYFLQGLFSWLRLLQFLATHIFCADRIERYYKLCRH